MKLFKTELGYKVTLSRGKYIIDDKPLVITEYKPTELIISSPIIKIVSETRLLLYYTDLDDNQLSEKDYVTKTTNLSQYRDSDGVWDTVENRDNFNLFIKTYKPVFKVVEQVSDPIIVEIVDAVFDSGNKFITPMLSVGVDSELCTYHRRDACVNILSKTLDDLGFQYKQGAGYKETENKKIYSLGNTHLGVAMGDFLFDNRNSSRFHQSSLRGSIDHCKKVYEADKEEIERVIKAKYALSFGKATIDQEKLFNKLQIIRNDLASLDVKVKSSNDHITLVRSISELIKEIEVDLSKTIN